MAADDLRGGAQRIEAPFLPTAEDLLAFERHLASALAVLIQTAGCDEAKRIVFGAFLRAQTAHERWRRGAN